MAPPACIDRALTYCGVNPTWVPVRVVAAHSATVISVLWTVDHVVPLKTAARCMSGVAPCCRRCATRRWMAATAHAWGCPVTPCLMDSPFDAIVHRLKEEANKGGGGAGGDGSPGGLGGLVTHEELYVAQVEGSGDGVGTAGSVLSGSK